MWNNQKEDSVLTQDPVTTSMEADQLNTFSGPLSVTRCIVAPCHSGAEGGRGSTKEKPGDKAQTMPANRERKGMKICWDKISRK